MKSENFLERYLPKNKRVRMFIILIIDIFAIWFASFLGLLLRFDLNVEKVPKEYTQAAQGYLPYYIMITIIIFFLFRMYSTMWSVAGIRDRKSVV